ncbi:hypothetical protein EKO27_g2642 [Xylaria grammica]|uniref:3'-5' exonuclease domain-containing protein n=1 Tax=Xylaria grammica TaxID=363999 RepID=A0A439DDJ0_9PEZI|nr:hypothetical protein EKO27_g2642 [Xylaria grammica]
MNSHETLPTDPPSFFIDLEGENLSRHGTISILQLHVLPRGQTRLFDIMVLGGRAFATAGTSGCTFKDVLESKDIPNVFFDVRNDSDALCSHFQIKLSGVQDLQLMQLATRQVGRKRYVCGLAKCIADDAPMSDVDKATWKTKKVKGLKLFAPEMGGSDKVLFNERPPASEGNSRVLCSRYEVPSTTFVLLRH